MSRSCQHRTDSWKASPQLVASTLSHLVAYPAQVRRRRIGALGALLAITILVAVVLLRGGGGGEPERLVPGGGERSGDYDPLAYDSGREDELVRRATAGFADVVYE